MSPWSRLTSGGRWVRTALLLAIASVKNVGGLHALSIAGECSHWNSDGSGVPMWPDPSFLSKKDFQLFTFSSFSVFTPQPRVEDLHPNVSLHFPVHALKQYLHVSAGYRKSNALFVCCGRHRKGCALS